MSHGTASYENKLVSKEDIGKMYVKFYRFHISMQILGLGKPTFNHIKSANIPLNTQIYIYSQSMYLRNKNKNILIFFCILLFYNVLY